MSLLKPYKGEPPTDPIIEEPPKFEGQEEILQPKSILQHEEKILRSGKSFCMSKNFINNFFVQDVE